MKTIVAVDRNWAIGNKGQLLVNIPNDQKMFRMETTGKVVVYGRKTIETFPGGMPLASRTNIILSGRVNYHVKGATVVSSVERLMEELESYAPDDVYVIGGASVYEQLLSLCDEALVTKIDNAFEADAYFPNLDENPEWELIADSEEQTYFDLEYRFLKYRRK
ncbi:dihydrofolate reductase [bacterium C-53]|nr:dihydrofolate reductase [Lachnospiraceae bacterium]NBI02090.1 dihydrofolate reductase [Lachnospiraceae bacterium]RKJ10353.1 dihydrofolate reductase [bacterium C-53]